MFIIWHYDNHDDDDDEDHAAADDDDDDNDTVSLGERNKLNQTNFVKCQDYQDGNDDDDDGEEEDGGDDDSDDDGGDDIICFIRERGGRGGKRFNLNSKMPRCSMIFSTKIKDAVRFFLQRLKEEKL